MQQKRIKPSKEDLKKVGRIGFKYGTEKYNLFRYFWSPDAIEGKLGIAITIPKKYTNTKNNVYYLEKLKGGEIIKRHKSYSKLLKIEFHSSGAYHISGENMPSRNKNPYAMKVSAEQSMPLGFMYTDNLSHFIHKENINNNLNTHFIANHECTTVFTALYRIKNDSYIKRKEEGIILSEELRDHIINNIGKDKNKIGIDLNKSSFIPISYPGNIHHIFLLVVFPGISKSKEIGVGTFVGTYAYEPNGEALSLYIDHDNKNIPEIKFEETLNNLALKFPYLSPL